ncbi:MAG: autotransporter-associated beta strand repeat-containing protein [bacterium]
MNTKMRVNLVVAMLVMSICFNARADNGTWTNLVGGSWATGGNWLAGTIANGADFTADFSTLNITAARTVTLDGSRTIGNLSFADATTQSHDWTLATGSAGPLTLAVSSGSPTITVVNRAATISAVLDGTSGLTKAGVGTLTLSAVNTYTGDTMINAGTLVVTNSGAINTPFSTLNIVNGTNTLLKDGSIKVQTLLATNVVLGGATSSIFNFNGGTLTTSNAVNTVAAKILLASGTNLNLNGIWNMISGTNSIASVQTGGTFGTVYVGNGVNNAAVYVNSNAVWSLGVNKTATVDTNLYLTVGNGTATNNLLQIDGGVLTSVGRFALGGFGNQVVVTNGGRLYSGGTQSAATSIGGTSNTVVIAGTNSAGGKATWDMLNNGQRFNQSGVGNVARVDQGGQLLNISVYGSGLGNSLVVTNGGYVTSGTMQYLFRYSSSNSLIVAGADSGGNKATFNASGQTFNIGVDYTTTGNYVKVDQGGVLTAGVFTLLGSGNYLMVTNGGQFTSSVGTIGGATNNNNNYVTIAGNGALWNLGGKSLTNGYNVAATGSVVNVLSGGILTNAINVVLGGVNSKFNLNGIAYVSGINLSVSDAQLNFAEGGILCARANGFLISGTGTTTFSGAGGVINTGTFTVTNEVVSTGTGGLTKIGTGTLTLTGANAYTGNTVISNGTLELVTAGNATLSDDTVVRIGTSGKMKLASGVIERVYELYLNDERALVGTWGSTSSTAAHKNDIYFTPGSTGVLDVRTGRSNGTLLQIF